MTLGKRIKELRQRAGLTQEELAKEIGYSTKTSISKIENDVLDITQSTIVALARALKTTPSVIMGWSEINDVPFSLNNLFLHILLHLMKLVILRVNLLLLLHLRFLVLFPCCLH